MSILIGILSAPGCGEPPAQLEEAPPPWGYTESGDLAELRSHGRLRVAAQRRPDAGYLPRTASARPRLKELAEELAADLNLEMQIVWVDSEAEALASVLDGRADIALGRMMRLQTEAPRGAAFTLPVSVSLGHIVTRTDDELADYTGLAGRRVERTLGWFRRPVPSAVRNDRPLGT